MGIKRFKRFAYGAEITGGKKFLHDQYYWGTKYYNARLSIGLETEEAEGTLDKEYFPDCYAKISDCYKRIDDSETLISEIKKQKKDQTKSRTELSKLDKQREQLNDNISELENELSKAWAELKKKRGALEQKCRESNPEVYNKIASLEALKKEVQPNGKKLAPARIRELNKEITSLYASLDNYISKKKMIFAEGQSKQHKLYVEYSMDKKDKEDEEGNKGKKNKKDKSKAPSTKAAEQASDDEKKKNLFWGVKNQLASACQQALDSKRGKGGKKCKFKSYCRSNYSGAVTMQLQDSAKAKSKNLHILKKPGQGTISQVYIAPVPEEVFYIKQAKKRARACRTPGWLFFDEQQQKIEFNVFFHRPLPPDGTIKYVSLIARRRLRGWKYELQFTVEAPSLGESPKTPKAVDAVAIDAGWRSGDEGMRILYASDTAGDSGEVLLLPYFTNGLKKIDSLKSTLDKEFNDIKAKMIGWGKEQTFVDEEIAEQFRYMHQWESIHKMRRLYYILKKKQPQLFDNMEENSVMWYFEKHWIKDRYPHLGVWIENMRDKLYRRREDDYRKLANQYARKYTHIFIENLNLPGLKKGKGAGKGSRRNGNYAAIGTFFQFLREACRQHGSTLVEVNPANTTKTCNHCGKIDKHWENKSEQYHTCVHCGARWDRDNNASRNILKKGLELIDYKKEAA